MCTLNSRLWRVSAFHSCMALVRMVLDQSWPQVAPSIISGWFIISVWRSWLRTTVTVARTSQRDETRTVVERARTHRGQGDFLELGVFASDFEQLFDA